MKRRGWYKVVSVILSICLLTLSMGDISYAAEGEVSSIAESSAADVSASGAEWTDNQGDGTIRKNEPVVENGSGLEEGTVLTDGAGAEDGSVLEEGTVLTDGSGAEDGSVLEEGTVPTDGAGAEDGSVLEEGTVLTDGSGAEYVSALGEGAVLTDGPDAEDGSALEDGTALTEGAVPEKTANKDGESSGDSSAAATTAYIYYLDGNIIGTYSEIQSNIDNYDGYVIKVVDENAKTMKLTPVAASGYEFALLNLVDSNGRKLSPVSTHYKMGSGVADADYTITVNYGADADGTENDYTFQEQPAVTAFFDKAETINSAMWDCGVDMDAKFASIITDAKISAYNRNWSGCEFMKGESMVFYAGEGKQFRIEEMVLYGRCEFAHNRFEVVTFSTSTDGTNFTKVSELPKDGVTQSEQYSTPRFTVKDLTAPYIKIESEYNNRNISMIKFYGEIIADQTQYESLKAVTEACKAAYDGEQGNYSVEAWNAFKSAYDAALTYIEQWEKGSLTDSDTLKSAEEALEQAYGTLLESVALRLEYQAFKDGVLVEIKSSPVEFTREYDGYVRLKLAENGQDVTILPVPAEGREFSLMTLSVVDGDGNLVRSISPISRDYRRKAGTTKSERIYDGNYQLELKLEAADGGEGSLAFQEIPQITAYFDVDSHLLNDAMLELVTENQNNMHGLLGAGIHAAGEDWPNMFPEGLISQTNGLDLRKGNYALFYAGEGKQFSIDSLVVYGRAKWAHNRFTGFVLETSNDGVQYMEVMRTANYAASRMWETPRAEYDTPIHARYIRISNDQNICNLSSIKFYGVVEEDQVGYYALSEAVEAGGKEKELGQRNYSEETWNQLLEAYEKALALKGQWEDDGQPNPDNEASVAAANALYAAIQGLAEPVPHYIDNTGGSLLHPAIGNSPEDLIRIRNHVLAGEEPWSSAFAEFSLNEYASKDYQIKNDKNPGGEERVPVYGYGDYASSLFNGNMKKDATAAYYQSIMYFMTGDVEYREKAMRILRLWSILDPSEAVYVNDAHIHHAEPTLYFNCAAELMRYTSTFREDLVWTDEDTRKYTVNYILPTLDKKNGWFASNTEWFNQHQTVLMARMSSQIFLDDAAGYEETVEWYTVNSTAYGTASAYHNGSIKNAMPLLTKNVDGTAAQPYVAVAEMVRDQPHAMGNVGGLMTVSRMLTSQGTKVDPEDGTVSETGNAVDVYDFLDSRLLKGANYWCRYNLGHEDMPFYDSRGGVLSDSSRGRMQSLFEYYMIYKYKKGYKDTDEDFRYVAEVYHKYQNLYGNDRSDTWLYIPEEAAGAFTAAAQKAYGSQYEFESQANWFCEGIQATEDGSALVVDTSSNPVLCMYNFYNAKAGKIALRYRSSGISVMEIRRYADSDSVLTLALPSTNGEWRYVVYNPVPVGAYLDNQIFYFAFSSEDGTKVELDHLIVKDNAKTPPVFADGKEERILYVYPGMQMEADCKAADSNTSHTVSYSLQGDVPEGLSVDTEGMLHWDVPAEYAAEQKTIYLVADDGESLAVQRIILGRGEDYKNVLDAMLKGYDESAVYESESKTVFDEAYAYALSMEGKPAEEQNAALARLEKAVDSLRLLNPVWTDEMTGNSLDYSSLLHMNYKNAKAESADEKLPLLLDGDWVTHTGDVWDSNEKSVIFDFGHNFRFKASGFWFAPRNTFASRTAGMVVFGSDDCVNWEPLTDFTEQIDGWQKVAVYEEKQNVPYRYFMIRQMTVTGVHPMSFAELRMEGERLELLGCPDSVSISSNVVSTGSWTANGNSYNPKAYRADSGDEIYLSVTSAAELKDLSVTIEGQKAQVSNPVNEGEGYSYQASIALAEVKGNAHNAEFRIQYRNADGTMSEPICATTDGTSVWVSNQDKLIDRVAERAVSENGVNLNVLFDNDMGTWTASSVHGSILLDFGDECIQLQRIEVLPRYDFCNRLQGFTVAASEDGVSWRNISRPSMEYTTSWKSVEIFEYDQSKNYRYLKLCGSAWYGNVAEVRLYGECGTDLKENVKTYTVTTSANIAEGGKTEVYYTNEQENGEAVLSGITGGKIVTIKATPAEGYEFQHWQQKKDYFGLEYDYHFAKDSGAEYILQYNTGGYQGGTWYREVISDMDLVAVFAKSASTVDKSVLDSLITAARSVEKELDKYKEEGKAEFQKALEEAVKGQEDSTITQEQVDALCETLKTCMESLKLIDSGEASPSPKPTESAEPTGSPKPTESAEPTGSPKPTESADPTGSPKPTESAEPTGSPEPIESPKPTESADPTGSPKPTESADPTGSPKPTESADPTGSPKPTESADPTGSPEPIESPKPTESAEPTGSPKPIESAKPADSPKPVESARPTEMPTETPKPVRRVENVVSDTIPETVMVDAVRNTTGCKNTDELLAYMKKLITSDGEAAKHLSGIPEDNTKVVDVTVRISMDGGLTWEDATAENFPAEGVDVLLPYPSETLRENNGQYDFVVGHLMTSGPNAGKMEYFTPEKTEEGLKVHVYSTSPFVIGWNEKASEPGENQNPAQPADSGQMEARSPKTYDSGIASDTPNIFDTVWFSVVAVLLGCAVSVVMMYFHKKKERDR